MPLTPINELVQNAREHQYAIGYFESWNLESLQGVLDAAEATRSPIIVGFNGEFLSHPGRKQAERLECYAALGKAAATSASVPCGLIFNECPNDEWVRNAVLAGFNLVMPADQGAEAIYGEELWRCPAYPSRPVDPSGAGDAFASGLITGLGKGWTISQSLQYASLLGASATQAIGTTDGVLT
jgi:sugar/nucleoside kinase (ribokinase family)